MNKYTAGIITISDKGSKGERKDESGPLLAELLKEYGWDITYTSIIPDEEDIIKEELIKLSDEGCTLILTTGGTGFSPRDITPEATSQIIERMAPGISEAMRAESFKITNRGCLSRGISGIRKRSLIVNLPGSPKAAKENILAVIEPIKHGIDMLLGEGSADCAKSDAEIISVCISEKKGTMKHEVESIEVKIDHGIIGDAHAGNWHRQISLLGIESVDKIRANIDRDLPAGAFAENILTKGITLYKLKIGTKLKVGSSILEVTQIGKECHHDCEIRRLAGDCVMPREGIFTKVIEEGTIKKGDKIKIYE